MEAIDKRPLLLVLVKLRRSSNETAPVVRKHGAVAKARNVVSFLKQKKKVKHGGTKKLLANHRNLLLNIISPGTCGD